MVEYCFLMTVYLSILYLNVISLMILNMRSHQKIAVYQKVYLVFITNFAVCM